MEKKMKERINYQHEIIRMRVEPLRACVSEIMSELLHSPDEAGRYIRESVGLFFDEYEEQFTESFVFSPDLMLFVRDASLARYHNGQTYEVDKNSPTGFKYQQVRSVVRQNQEEMYPVWLSHSGLILNAIENNFGRGKLLIS